ncbi:class I SAM-dependent methyltransferase [Azospirillum sp. ST 5-10]|uniref:class I SAM-dependent methyltransferase n=1 Tax=unclassified Azospirillum TaxID=2630922 RepID=UPI003F4A76BC
MCKDDTPKHHVLDVAAGPADRPLSLRRCPACGTGYFADAPAVEYAVDAADPTALAFYLEQGAGIDVMVAPLAAVDPTTVARYLEIGCGFGFSLDFARVAYGWRVCGIDPGGNARAGRDLLGLDIRSEYLSDALPDAERPDLILCSEVIEHIGDPDAFLATLRAALAADGTLLLTTPSVEAVRPDTPPGVLLPVLSPGYHVILYSPRGLELVLRRAGFDAVTVTERGSTLVASAGGTPRLQRPLDRGLFRSYLAKRCAEVDGATPLGIGLRARHVKELVNAGAYADAAVAAADLREAWQRGWPSDPADPATLAPEGSPLPDGLAALHREVPFCAASAAYHLGILAWQHAGDLAAARACFAAAARTGERLRALLRRIGSDDGETDHLVWRARSNLVRLAAWTAPAEAVELAEAFGRSRGPLLDEPVPPDLVHETAGEVLVTLVNRGQYEHATRMSAAVVTVPEEMCGLTDALVSFVRGILGLNAHRSYARAAAEFARAHRICRGLVRSGRDGGGALVWESLYHQALAWVLAGDARQASSAASELARLSGRDDLPPLPRSVEDKMRALAQAHHLA